MIVIFCWEIIQYISMYIITSLCPGVNFIAYGDGNCPE